MDKIKELFYKLKENPLYTFIAGLVVGLIIGLPVLGWGLFPVKWTDADPSYLHQHHNTMQVNRHQYIECMTMPIGMLKQRRLERDSEINTYLCTSKLVNT